MGLARTAALLVGLSALNYTSVLQADLPEPMQITYTMRANPADPQSPITFITRLDLSAVAAEGDAVGWHVDRITIEQNMGTSYRKWTEDEPAVDSADGLWWIVHLDPQNPWIKEFAEMPGVWGRATPVNINDPELDYDLVSYDKPDPVGRTITAVSYSFQAVGAVAPETEEEDEDAEVDEGSNDPA